MGRSNPGQFGGDMASSARQPPPAFPTRGFPTNEGAFRSGSIGPGAPQNWRSNSLSFLNPQSAAAAASLPSSYELAMLQAQRGMDMERMQRMSLGLGARRRSSMSEASSMGMSFSMYANAEQATERLKKKRRIASPTNLSNQGGNSFPMPPLEGEERNVGIIEVLESLETFRQLWDEHEERAKILFPDDVDQQKEYAKCRLRSSIARRNAL